jgi:hypothetical protein
MFSSHKAESSDFLPGLTQAFVDLDVNAPLPTKQFTDACSKVMPIFDHIGEWFSGPKNAWIWSRKMRRPQLTTPHCPFPQARCSSSPSTNLKSR